MTLFFASILCAMIWCDLRAYLRKRRAIQEAELAELDAWFRDIIEKVDPCSAFDFKW